MIHDDFKKQRQKFIATLLAKTSIYIFKFISVDVNNNYNLSKVKGVAIN